MESRDPRREVEAPIRRAVVVIAAEGLVAAVASLAMLWVMVASGLPAAAHELVAIGLPAGLLVYAAVVGMRRLARGPVPSDLAAGAWMRAAAVDPDTAALARPLAAWAPLAVLVCLAVSFWSHVAGHPSTDAATWWLLGFPGYGAAWLLATLAWGDACRDAIARAELVSAERFRAYWSHPARP